MPTRLPGLGLSVQQTRRGMDRRRTIARRPEKTRLLRSRLPRTTSACAPSSLLYSNFHRGLPPSSRLQVSRGRRLAGGAVAVCAAARRRGGDGVPRQAGARAHGPRGNSSRPEPLPRIRWLDLLSRFPSSAYDFGFELGVVRNVWIPGFGPPLS